MKKFIPFLAALLAAAALGSCGSKEKEYQKPTDTKLWVEVLNKTLAQNGATDFLPGPSGGAIIEPDATPSEGGRVVLTTRQAVSSGQTAIIEWDYEYDKAKIDYKFMGDDDHEVLEFKHNGVGGAADYFNFTIKRIIIGDYALSTADLNTLYKQDLGDENENLNYVATLNPYKYVYEDLKIADLSKANAAGDGYDCIDYTMESPFFRTINEQDYRYSTLKGKVLYMTPDFNFGVIADGDDYTEVYFGGSDGSRSRYFPGLKVGQYCEVRGNFGQYKGNFQFSYIQRARVLEDHSMVKEPGNVKEITESYINTLNLSSGKQEFVVPGLMNSLVKATGTFVAGSLKNDASKTIATIPQTNGRYTFEIQVGSVKQKISYDYHTAKTATGEDDFSIINAINAFIADGSNPHTISGTIRYEGNGVAAKKGSGTGVWTISPLTVDDIK